MSVLDELCPPYFEERRIKLTRADPLTRARARAPIRVLVDYSACEPQGVVLPFETLITGPSGESSFVRHISRRFAPTSITFTPREGGKHSIVLREVGHNRWWGRLDVDVEGDKLEDPEP